MATGEKPDTESSTETRTAESASWNHAEERNDTRTLTSIPPDLSQQETRESSQSGLFLARVASNLTSSQKTGIDDYTESSEDLDFDALSNFEDMFSQDNTTSDSDETIISDFDELEGVSEGELSFSDQSQPPSPLLLGSTKTTLSNITHKSPPTSLEVVQDNTNAIPIEPMDTSCEDKANVDEGNCCGDEASTMCSPMLACRDTNSPSGQISSQTQSSLCMHADGDDLIGALPNSECEEQHIPWTHEQVKKPKDECDIDNDSMSHLSDREWTELSFESPVFIQGGNGNDTSVGGFTNSTRLHNNSAFDCLEDYEDTLSQSEDETICADAVFTPACHNSMKSSDTTCSNAVSTHINSLCENGGTTVVRGVAPVLVATCTASPLTHDITDEDFCWDE